MKNEEQKTAEAGGEPRSRQDDKETAASPSRFSSILITLIGLVIICGPHYYAFIWSRQSVRTPVKWLIVLAILGSLVGIIAMAFRSMNAKTVRVVSNIIVVLLIVFGAANIAISFSKGAQNFLFSVFLIAYLSFLPPWLYLQFISIKGRSLWEEYVLNLYRLHFDSFASLPEPPKDSIFYEKRLAEVQKTGLKHAERKGKTLYQIKFEGLYGSVMTGDTPHFLAFQGENFLPVAIAAVLISIGWVFAIQPESILNITLSSKMTAGGADLYFKAVRFSFLGAYFYILQMLVRRYFQNDLRTNAYVHSIMRVIIAVVLAWVIAAVAGSEQKGLVYGLAFIVGVFPYVGWQAIQAFIKIPLKVLVPSLQTQYPLSDLNGLTIWHESRLLEEGIEDMQNLATANIVDLMLNTRIPIERLIDWIDQSLLYVHLGKGEADGKETNREKLRRFGIRTASDLIDLFECGEEKLIGELESVLNKDPQEASCLRCIYITIKNEPNLFHVRQWISYTEAIGAR